MNKKQWKPVNRIEEQYSTLLKKLLAPIEKEIKKNGNTVDKVVQILNRATESKTYNKKAEEIAKTIATMVWEDGARNWRQAAKKSSRGREIFSLLKKEMTGDLLERYNELIQYNTTLIKTLPLEISKEVVEHINKQSTTGERASDISKEIKQFFPERTKANARLIARTETSKTSSALTQARSESIGIDWYVWRSSEDQRVRSSHAHMDGVVIAYNDPPIPERLDPDFKGNTFPQPYHAGNIYNCRCYQSPLISFSDVTWPAKVYYNGKIERISLSKFKEIGGREFDE